MISLPVDSWKEYRDLRLRALKEDPGAFTSAYPAHVSEPDEFWQRRLQTVLDGQTQWLLFARDGGRLVGMIGAFARAETPDTAVIISVYVPREERGRGISNLLMDAILKHLEATGRFRKARLGVNVTQTAALRLYEKFGFREIGREPSTTGDGQTVEQIEMERELRAEGE